MVNKFLENVENGQWDDASRALKRIKNLDTLSSALKSMTESLARVPPTLIQGILIRAKAILTVMKSERRSEAFMAASEFTCYLTDKFVRLLCQDASLESLRLFLRELPISLCEDGVSSALSTPAIFSLRYTVRDIWEQYLRDDHLQLKARNIGALVRASNTGNLEAEPELLLLWQRTELILRAAMGRDVDSLLEDGRHWKVVHAIVAMECPTIVLWWALERFPSQIRERDSLGNLPIHYAVKSIERGVMGKNGFYKLGFPEALREANMSLILLLLSRFPEGARYLDRNGQLPLSLALMTNQCVREASTWLADVTEVTRFHPYRTIEALATAAPEALVTRDPVKRFYPYQLAAVEGAELSVIYKLLIQNPTSLKYRTLTTSEIHNERLENDKIELQMQNQKLREELRECREENERLKRELARCTEGGCSSNRKRSRTT